MRPDDQKHTWNVSKREERRWIIENASFYSDRGENDAELMHSESCNHVICTQFATHSNLA